MASAYVVVLDGNVVVVRFARSVPGRGLWLKTARSIFPLAISLGWTSTGPGEAMPSGPL